ncbi:hypothetical protein [Sphingomonas glaciei]|uniref:Uncharacterized protein n=1 Tax=Sphingomonas glaciei TaxID=2938948 RepID=A0ABY5MTH9_9SPHN|nr:hypothetical protein [Sphingomonas glaciei]UUR06739.1 hypothetical protein M1K48_07155 [Sphingomonas glaciei]
MKTAPVPSLGFVLDPIPEPPVQIRRLMLALGTILDGYIEQDPQSWHPALLHSMVVPGADIVLAGTRCRRPLVCREVGNIARAVDRDAIIVRAADEPKHATFDVLLRHLKRPFLGYRLWMRQPLGSAWLVPTGAERTFIRLDGLGLELSLEAPFDDEIDAYRGLKAGAEYLSIAVKGWF